MNYNLGLRKINAETLKSLKGIFTLADAEVAKSIAKYKLRYPKTYKRGLFYAQNRALAEEIKGIMKQLQFELDRVLTAGLDKSWNLANTKNDVMIQQYLAGTGITSSLRASFMKVNMHALQAFVERSQNGITLSDRIWNLTIQKQEVLERYLASGITVGRSASQMSRDIRLFEINPNKLFRRVRDEKGTLQLSKNAKNYHPGMGVYRSSYKNAMRVARTENQIAFHTADFNRVQKLPFVKGIRVILSASHPRFDICDPMAGDYPKDFLFTGWHPNCYDKETELFTNNGWKYFKDLDNEDLVLSLNPESLDLEYSPIVAKMSYQFNGDMFHFHSRSLDMMVTPDHKMIGFAEWDNKVHKMPANEYASKMYKVSKRNIFSTKYRMYRSSKWIGKDTRSIRIGKYSLNTKIYCEFMGYYLSEGSTSRKYAINVGQSKSANPINYKKISDCLLKLPFSVSENDAGFNFYDKDFWEYLKQFGKSFEKYIPDSIKELNPQLLEVFLEAFCVGDGSIRKSRNFKNGNFKDSRTFSSSSKIMADGIGELILKIGHHPSFYLAENKGKMIKFSNGTYKINHDQWIISDCYSQHAGQFNKETVKYNDMVYDVEILKNHIIYVRRNGKCVWGSNCICYTTTILSTKNEFKNFLETGSMSKAGTINAIPKSATSYIAEQKPKLKAMKSKPYWYEDNFENYIK